MIVTTGRIIRIEAGSSFVLERSCETPGAVTLIERGTGARITLPAHDSERENIIGAYRRACAEDIAYRQSQYENAPPEPEEKPHKGIGPDGARGIQKF